MLLLELLLPGCPDGVDVRPVLEKDVRREEGVEPPPVAPVLLEGDCPRMDKTGLSVRPFRSSVGMSAMIGHG